MQKKVLEVISTLSNPKKLDALLTWPRFSFNSYRIVSSLKEQNVIPRTVIDVGANIGQFSIACSKLLDSPQIYAFEPVPSCHRQFLLNTERLLNIIVYPVALGALLTITYFLIKNGKERVVAYVTPSGGSGLIFDLCVYWLLVKLNISTIIYHHHSFSYLNKSKVIQKIAETSNKSCHIFLGDSMKKTFLKVYGTQFEDRAFTVDKAWCLNVTKVPNSSRQDKDTEICLGHLSNLCEAKGLYTVVGIFEKLVQKGKSLKLHLAGPASESDTIFIQSLIVKYGNLVQWLGPVYELNKQRWYENIDVFLFPSRYVNEAQPMVILEAMSHRCTVIATQRGCIPEILVEGSGYAIAEPEFEDAAVQVLKSLIDDTDKLNLLKSNAYSLFKDMQALAQLEMNHILSILPNSKGADAGARTLEYSIT